MIAWPSTHPARTDPALAPWAGGAEEVCPGARVGAVLRHLPGRRVASLVERAHDCGVLKVFASPRARGNHRRLAALHATAAAHVVPRPIAVDVRGHVSLVEYVAGTPMPDLDDRRYVDAARLGGAALRQLHRSAAVLDRCWEVRDEIEQLRRTSGPLTQAVVERVIGTTRHSSAGVVTAHRDCHPAQLVLTGGGHACWIDLDDAAMAPAGLDVGNFIAHLEAEAATGRRGAATVEAAVAAFVDGYGVEVPDVAAWRRLSLARLCALAETRHGDRARIRQMAEVMA